MSDIGIKPLNSYCLFEEINQAGKEFCIEIFGFLGKKSCN